MGVLVHGSVPMYQMIKLFQMHIEWGTGLHLTDIGNADIGGFDFRKLHYCD